MSPGVIVTVGTKDGGTGMGDWDGMVGDILVSSGVIVSMGTKDRR